MSKKIFAFQSTAWAYTVPPESAFSTVSEHATLSAAQKAQSADRAEMRRNCGQNAWSHNTRIIALRDVTMRHHCPECGAPLDTYAWPVGETRPTGQDWELCAECTRRAAADEAATIAVAEEYEARCGVPLAHSQLGAAV